MLNITFNGTKFMLNGLNLSPNGNLRKLISIFLYLTLYVIIDYQIKYSYESGVLFLQNAQKSLSTGTIKRGLLAGIDVTWQLARIVIPIYFVVTFLKHTPVLDIISGLFSPLMRVFGLPGKAAIVLVLGNVVNLYAAIGAMVSLSLNLKEITVLAIMLSFCHSLPVETALAKKIGLSAINVIAVRAGLAILSGIAFNLILG